MNRNLVGSIYMYGRLCIKFPQAEWKVTDTGSVILAHWASSLKMPSLCDNLSFSITIQPRFTILGSHIDHLGYISSRHVSPVLDHIVMVYRLLYLRQVLVIRSVSPCSLDSPYMVHTLIMVNICQTDILHLTFTSFSWSTDFIIYMLSFPCT